MMFLLLILKKKKLLMANVAFQFDENASGRNIFEFVFLRLSESPRTDEL